MGNGIKPIPIYFYCSWLKAPFFTTISSRSFRLLHFRYVIFLRRYLDGN